MSPIRFSSQGIWAGAALAAVGVAWGFAGHAPAAPPGQAPPAKADSSGGAQEEDIWRPGCSLEPWRRIEAIQKHGLFPDAPEPDWDAHLKDGSPFVRAAACLALGRGAKPAHVLRLAPLLKDECGLVRDCALWALLQIDSPQVRQPIWDALNTWESLEGLPGPWPINAPPVFQMPLERRRAWLKGAGLDEWKVQTDPKKDRHAWGDGYTKVFLGLARCEWDAGEPIPIRTQVTRIGGQKPRRIKLTGGGGTAQLGMWVELDRMGDPGREMYEHRVHFPQALGGRTEDIGVAVEPNATAHVEVTVPGTQKAPPPGMYLFRAFYCHCPVLVRVRRSAAFERQIPDLLARAAKSDAAAVETLGEQRVTAATGTLIEVFRRNAGSRANAVGFAIADALARIGDPAAVPVLLDHPDLRNLDVMGDTSRALKAFGDLARPHFERRIISWRQELAAGRARTLSLCIRLLGSQRSEKVDRAFQDILAHADQQKDPQLDPIRAEILRAQMAGMRAKVVALAANDPEGAAAVIWRLRQMPADWAGLFADLERLEARTRDTVLAKLWERAWKSPDRHVLFRSQLFSKMLRACPPAVLADAGPIASQAEADEFLHAAIREPAWRKPIAAMVAAFLKQSPKLHPWLRVGLAKVYCLIGTPELAEDCLAAGLADASAERPESLWYALGEARLARIDGLGAMKAFQAALDRAGPNGSCVTFADGSLQASHLRMKIQTAVSMVPLAGLSMSRHWGFGPSGTGYAETAGGRLFGLDHDRRMYWWDPIARDGGEPIVMPQVVRDFMPLDGERVFVAFHDGTAALYQFGREGPLWRRPLSLGFSSYLTASPAAITAADEKGTLHVLNPGTGQTLWTRPVAGKAWPKSWWRSRRGPVAHDGRGVLVPDRAKGPPGALEWVELATGKTRWTYRPGIAPHALALGKDLLIIAEPAGLVAALSLEDGRIKWRRQLEGRAAYAMRDLRVAFAEGQQQVYVALREAVFALAADSGQVLWRWKWQALPDGDPPGTEPMGPMLCPVGNALVLVMNWPAAKPEGRERTDLVFFSPQGAVLLHRTTPVYTHNWAENVLLSGHKLALRKGMQWEVWDVAAAAADKLDKDVREAVLLQLRYPAGCTDQHVQECRKLIAQLDDPAYARRKAAAEELSERFWLYRSVIEKAADDPSLPGQARSMLKHILARRPDRAAVKRAAEGLATNVGCLIRLLKQAPESDRPLAASALERITGRKLGADPAAWEKWWAELWAVQPPR